MSWSRRPRGLSILLTVVLLAGLAVAPSISASTGEQTLAESAVDLGFDGAAPPDTVADFPGFQACIHREGRVFIAGQPSEEAMRSLPARGVTAVVNLRTPAEMDNRERVPFDGAALLRELELEYVWIPLGGDEFPYTPAAVDTFAAVLERHRGPVLLHCTVAWRASHLWAAYLVRYRGFAVGDAYARGEAMGIGRMPFARLLDRELRVTGDD